MYGASYILTVKSEDETDEFHMFATPFITSYILDKQDKDKFSFVVKKSAQNTYYALVGNRSSHNYVTLT